MSSPESHASDKRKIWRRFSQITLIVFVVVMSFRPMCACPGYYLGVAAIGLVPLACGPRLYRWLGSGAIVAALLISWTQLDALKRERERFQRLKDARDSHY